MSFSKSKQEHFSLNCGGQILDLSKPAVMAILNITPDSFYDGAKNHEGDALQEKLNQFVREGADIIDIGGMSSRPGAEIITVAEELDRVIPVIELIKKQYPQQLMSIDTLHHEVAKGAIAAGVHMVNDISGGDYDSKMYDTVADSGLPYIMMHMRGTPKNMVEKNKYENLLSDITKELIQKIRIAKEKSINQIIIDPGFGFSKNIKQNFTLLKNLSILKILDHPILVGLSRKSMIYKSLHISAEEALNGSTALHMIALQNGANMLRVHDVKEAKEAIQLFVKYEALEN